MKNRSDKFKSILCECDICKKEFEYDGLNYRECVEVQTKRGWFVVKNKNGKWFDFCCKEHLNQYLKYLKVTAPNTDEQYDLYVNGKIIASGTYNDCIENKMLILTNMDINKLYRNADIKINPKQINN